MGKSFKGGKDKRERGGFLAVPTAVLGSRNYASLSSCAVKLLLDVGSQYRGNNNGDLCAAWKIMKPKGWRSEATLNRAKKELLDKGFLFETRKGHRPNLCSLYAISWLTLDPSTKYDIAPRAYPYGAWNLHEPLPPIRPKLAAVA